MIIVGASLLCLINLLALYALTGWYKKLIKISTGASWVDSKYEKIVLPGTVAVFKGVVNGDTHLQLSIKTRQGWTHPTHPYKQMLIIHMVGNDVHN